jgi:thioesterase domain-containing protein
VSDWSDRVRALSPAKRALLEELTRRRAAASSAAGVELLRAGPAGPVVLAHPIGGSLFCYVDLCQAIGAGHSVWGIAAAAALADPAGPADPAGLTVERLAEGYVAGLAAAGVTRPAALAGWSFGGLLAYEMARQWGSSPPVVLIDSVPWPPSAPPWDRPTTLRTFTEYLSGLAGHPQDLPADADAALWHLPIPEALEAAARGLREHGVDLGLTGPELTRRYWMYANAGRAMYLYRPAPYAGPVTMIRTAATVAAVPAGWPAGAGAPLTTLSVPGDHYTVLRPPVVARVAQALTEAAS